VSPDSDSESDYCSPHEVDISRIDTSTEYNSTVPYSLSVTNDNDSAIPYSVSLDSTVTIDIEDCHTSTTLSALNEDTTVTIDMGDVSSQYDYDIASLPSSLNSSLTVNYAEDRSLTIPKTV
jgi:hypothetical protein